MVDESTNPELTLTPQSRATHKRQTRRANVEEKKDGHRAYTAERKAKLIRLTEDLRNSDSLLTEFVGKPDQTATKYDLKLTEEEVSALAAIAGSQELNEEALAAIAGGSTNNGCVNGSCRDEI
jgi:hypothetical protein